MKKKKIIIGSLLGAFLCMGVGSIGLASSNQIEAYAFDEIQFARQYVIGDIISFPESGFTLGEDYYKAETVLYYPDGSAVLTTGEKFSQAGEYTVEYRAEVNGKLYSETYDFSVLEELYSVSSSRSSASYGLDNSQYQTGLNGIHLSLAENDTFTYNKILDLGKLDDEWVLSLMMLPQEKGTIDANVVMVKLTDAYDPSNEVYVRISSPNHPHKDGWSNQTGMLFAGTSPNLLMGMYGTRVRTAHDYWGYGYQYYFTFGDNVGRVGKNQASFKFDVENKLLHGPDPQGDGVTSTLFADLADESVYPSAWKGFTTGEVYLSLYCTDYYKESADIFITQIGTEDLTADYFQGGIESSVNVDLVDYDEDGLPVAEVGKEYPLFQGKVYDYYQGESAILPRVFYRYGTWMESEINVKNNAFIPDREGVYTLVYGHTDSFGNYVKKELEVQAVDKVDMLAASLPDDKATSVYLGIPVQFSQLNVTGGSGKPVTTITIEKDGVSTVVDEEYVFTAAGVYDVNYTVCDYLGTEATCSYQIEALLNPTPVAQGTVSLPKYFIEGQKYILPSLTFMDYSKANAQSLTADITVIDGDGTHKLVSQEYIAKANADGTVKVQYSVEGEALPQTVVPVVNVSGKTEGTIDLMKYFLLDEGISVGADPQGLRFAAVQDGGFEFINPLLADTFALTMFVDKTANLFSCVDVYLTDSVNEKEAIQLSFKKENVKGAIGVYVNGRRLNGSLNATYLDGKFLKIKFADNVLQVNGSQIYSKVNKTLNGDAFSGFTSGKVYMEIELSGIESVGSDNAAIVIRSLNSQTLSATLSQDKMGPQIIPTSTYQLVKSLGDTVTVYDVLAGDVLSSYTSGTLSVTYNNQPVTSVDGIRLSDVPLREYKFEISEYGEYSITYKVKDGEGNSVRAGNIFQIKVLDDIPPVLEIDSSIPYSVSVGKTVTLPEATVVDNVTAETEYYVYVAHPNGTIVSCREELKFTPDAAGTYIIMYMAKDAEGNLTVKRFTVEAE